MITTHINISDIPIISAYYMFLVPKTIDKIIELVNYTVANNSPWKSVDLNQGYYNSSGFYSILALTK